MPIGFKERIGQEEPVETVIGDDFFVGLDMQHDPGVVRSGFYSKGENIRAEDGVPQSRGGHYNLPWTATNTTTNGTFASDTGWVKGTGVTISGGTATWDGTQSADSDLENTENAAVASEIYVIGYTVSGQTAGNVTAVMGNVEGTDRTANGTFVERITASNTDILKIRADLDFDGSIDNVTSVLAGPLLAATFGAGRYSKPGGQEYIIVATGSQAYLIKEGEGRIDVTYPSGVTIADPVEFIQAFDLVFMLRGFNLAPLQWDGTIGGAFTVIDQSDPGGGFLAFPSAGTGTYLHGRLALIRDRDSIIVSDIFDETKFSIFNDLFVNRGSDDSLVAIHPIGNQTLVAFKDQSIFLIGNFFGDLSTLRLDDLNRSIGLKAKDSLVSIGDSIFFLSDQGICVVRQALDSNNRLKAVAVPISDSIQPLIDRITWGSAAGATATFLRDRIFFAVPIDGSTENNAVFVYRFVREGDDRGTFESLDIWSSVKFNIRKLVVSDYAGQKQLIAVTYDGYVYAYGYEFESRDFISSAGFQQGSSDAHTITSKFKTRGYGADEGIHKRTTHAYLQLETWAPTYLVSAFSDGANEEQKLIPSRTKNRLKYYNQGSQTRGVWTQQADYTENNTNDDHATSDREDYSINCDVSGGFDFCQSGANPELMQEIQEPMRINRFGRYVQLEITNTTGQLAVKGIRMGQRDPRKRITVAA